MSAANYNARPTVANLADAALAEAYDSEYRIDETDSSELAESDSATAADNAWAELACDWNLWSVPALA